MEEKVRSLVGFYINVFGEIIELTEKVPGGYMGTSLTFETTLFYPLCQIKEFLIIE